MTFNPDHILVPTDLSANTQKVLPYALNIALKTGARVTILHIIEDPHDFTPGIDNIKEKTEARFHAFMNELLSEIKREEKYRALDVSSVVRFGQSVSSILDVADKQNADFIVMGTRSASNIKKKVFGSNATEVILNAEIPVLSVPGNSTFTHLRRLTFTTDYKEYDLESLRLVTGLASFFDAEIDILHVAQKNDLDTKIKYRGFRELAMEEIAYEKMSYELVIKKNFFTGLADYQTNHDTRMIILSRYKKSFPRSFLKKDHSRQMLLYTRIPMMVIPQIQHK